MIKVESFAKFLYNSGMIKRVITCVLFLSLGISISANDTTGWVWVNHLGGSESFNSKLHIYLENDDDIKTHNADWDGRSLTNSIYYAVKLEKMA